MKKMFLAGFSAAALLLALTAPTFAADKEVTITGTGLCAKCSLHETDSCQNAIQVEKDGKKVTYYLVQNKESKAFHSNVCKASAKVTATGTVAEKDGKMMMTVSKIAKAE